MDEFVLYVFAFDDKCCEILNNENYRYMKVVPLEEFETEELLKVKKERTAAEYCWTCSPWIIKHVLDRYNEEICTYIDADMRFYSSPQPLFDKLRSSGKSTIIVPHRFRNEKEERKAFESVGSYCVEFNTFVNDSNGYEALSWWAERCLEWCYYTVPGTTEWYGDQKYLNVFPEKFEGIMICTHYGVGLAPWNIELVDYYGNENGVPLIKVKKTGEIFPVIIHHFENVGFVTEHILNASSRTKSKQLFLAIYKPYIERLIYNRAYIEDRYNIKLTRKKRIVTKNKLLMIYQRYFSPLRRIKHFRDLFWVK
ncbi:MAG: hypothetical protein IKE74_04425 [Mogibacterium sp.]|nr:hypothetical protein [Mogibacterium sp.]